MLSCLLPRVSCILCLTCFLRSELATTTRCADSGHLARARFACIGARVYVSQLEKCAQTNCNDSHRRPAARCFLCFSFLFYCFYTRVLSPLRTPNQLVRVCACVCVCGWYVYLLTSYSTVLYCRFIKLVYGSRRPQDQESRARPREQRCCVCHQYF